MRITDIRITLLRRPRGKVKAFATLILDDCLAVHDFRVIESGGRLFVSPPTRRTEQGEFKEIIQPVTGEMSRILQEEILRAYSDECSRPERNLEKPSSRV